MQVCESECMERRYQEFKFVSCNETSHSVCHGVDASTAGTARRGKSFSRSTTEGGPETEWNCCMRLLQDPIHWCFRYCETNSHWSCFLPFHFDGFWLYSSFQLAGTQRLVWLQKSGLWVFWVLGFFISHWCWEPEDSSYIH